MNIYQYLQLLRVYLNIYSFTNTVFSVLVLYIL